MKSPTSPYGRAPQILSLLAQHGPLSVRGLSAIMSPPIKRPRLKTALHGLLRRKLIKKKLPKLFRNAAVFYQIVQKPNVWKEIGSIIGCKPESLFQPQFRRVEYLHSESCAIWTNKLESLFPNMYIMRDYSLRSSGLARELLLETDNDIDFLPDLLMIAPANDGSAFISVAVEIECHMKTDDRTVMKLKKFASESRLDGVIWLCEDDCISSRLQRLYNKRVKEHALRTNNYDDNFMLFYDNVFSSDTSQLRLQNAACGYVDIQSWMRVLLSKSTHERKDVNFNLESSGTQAL